MVHEPVRTFEERLFKARVRLDRGKVKVVREDWRFVWIEHRTDARKRHFLCGRDERQLFICQLPRAVTTIRDAHEVLRAPEAARSKSKVNRQGEWFFVEPTVKELDALAAALRGFRTVVRRGVPIGRGGHPHVADELVLVPAMLAETKTVESTVLVRGPRAPCRLRHDVPAVVGQGRPQHRADRRRRGRADGWHPLDRLARPCERRCQGGLHLQFCEREARCRSHPRRCARPSARSRDYAGVQ